MQNVTASLRTLAASMTAKKHRCVSRALRAPAARTAECPRLGVAALRDAFMGCDAPTNEEIAHCQRCHRASRRAHCPAFEPDAGARSTKKMGRTMRTPPAVSATSVSQTAPWPRALLRPPAPLARSSSHRTCRSNDSTSTIGHECHTGRPCAASATSAAGRDLHRSLAQLCHWTGAVPRRAPVH